MYPTAFKDPRGGHNKRSINENFFKIWSPQMAYILGFIFADGAIEDVQKSSRTCYLSISASIKDLPILEQIKSQMSSSHQLYSSKAKLLTFPGGKEYLSKEKFTLRIGSKLIYNSLLELGVTPRKSLTILFPKIPTKCLSFFLRGYFDGDGCIYMIKEKYPRLIFTSGSKEFLEGVAFSLSKTLHIQIKTIYVQTPTNQNPCYRLHYNSKISRQILSFIYDNLEAAPYLERKYSIYMQYLTLA